jgi:hypothetical protein
VPKVTLTAREIEDALGAPIILLSGWDATTKTVVSLTAEELPQVAIAYLVAWVNARLSTP